MKKTGRLPRTHISNTIHHVMIRGNNRQRIFRDNNYYQRFCELLNDAGENFDHTIILRKTRLAREPNTTLFC